MGESNTEALSTQNYDWKTMLRDEVILWESNSIPDVEAVLARHPEMWREHGELIRIATSNLIRTGWAKEGERQSIEIGANKLKEELGYDYASQLERLSIEEVVIAWIRMGEVQERHTRLHHSANLTVRQSEYEEGLLLSAQKRYTRAMESLARIRKLLKGTTFVQINIAEDGGKQVNVLKIPDGRSPKVKRNINKAISSGTPADRTPPIRQRGQTAVSDESVPTAASVNQGTSRMAAAAPMPPSRPAEPPAKAESAPAPRGPALATVPSTKTNTPQDARTRLQESMEKIRALREQMRRR